MARLSKDSPFSLLKGTIGKEIVFKQYADKVVVSKYPDMSKVRPTEKQAAQRKLMAAANAYASKVLKDPLLRAGYEKELLPGESLFHKAKKAFLVGHVQE